VRGASEGCKGGVQGRGAREGCKEGVRGRGASEGCEGGVRGRGAREGCEGGVAGYPGGTFFFHLHTTSSLDFAGIACHRGRHLENFHFNKSIKFTRLGIILAERSVSGSPWLRVPNRLAVLTSSKEITPHPPPTSTPTTQFGSNK
jgi:hypothetical protein